jgi:IS5 family transposase
MRPSGLSDRLSFRRFVGLALADPVPDHSTLSRFRAELVRRGLSERLLAELNRQLDAKGLMVKSGTLIDASLVEADGRRPRQGEPVEGRSDRDATWNAMPEQPLFGYKAHLAVDHGSGLVRQAILTPANVSDKMPFLALVQGDEQAVYLAGRGAAAAVHVRAAAEPHAALQYRTDAGRADHAADPRWHGTRADHGALGARAVLGGRSLDRQSADQCTLRDRPHPTGVSRGLQPAALPSAGRWLL